MNEIECKEAKACTQVIGDSFPFYEASTDIGRKFIETQLSATTDIIFYGCTSKLIAGSKADTNQMVNEWIDKSPENARRVIANVVDLHSVMAVEQWGNQTAATISNFMLVYTHTPEPQARFGDDTPLDALTNNRVFCLNGGLQSLLQILNVISKDRQVIGVTKLREKDPDNFDPFTKKTYFSACDFLDYIKKAVPDEKTIDSVIDNYVNQHALYNSSKPDAATKLALWEKAKDMLVQNQLWNKLNLFVSIPANAVGLLSEKAPAADFGILNRVPSITAAVHSPENEKLTIAAAL